MSMRPEEKLGAYGVLTFFGGGCLACERDQGCRTDYHLYMQSRWKDSTFTVYQVGSFGYHP